MPERPPELLERPAPADAPPPAAPRPARLRNRRLFRFLAVVAVTLAVLLGTMAGALFVATENLGNNIKRVHDVFTPLLPGARPASTGQLTFLLIGRDSGVTPAPADVYMLASTNASRTAASVVALPPDLGVDVPGQGQRPLDAVASLGGPSMQVEAVEALTNLRVDHYAVVDFAELDATVDLVGGIELGVAEATRSGGVEFAEGSNRLDGAEMLAFLRQTDLPGGEADRAQRQQAVVRALSRQVIEQVPDRGPIAAYDLFDTASSALTVDDTLTNYNLRALGLELRNVRPATTSFLFAPVAGAAEGGVLSLDEARATRLWDALRTDSVDSYSSQFPDDVLGAEVP